MLISEVVKNYLNIHTYPDLAALYKPGLELQILVAKDDGWKVENEFKGRFGDSFTNGLETWYPIRLPKNAKSEPIDNDRQLTYNPDHFSAIGMSGWDYINRRSLWLGYDVDSIIGHSERNTKRLTEAELKDLQSTLESVPYVTIRKSTSGNGLHLYVFTEPVTTNNHIEHAALARYVLGKISSETGKDFDQKIDVYGNILWCWRRGISKESTGGLELIKQGETLRNIPNTWREHISVVSGKRKKAIPFFINPSIENDSETEIINEENKFLEITGQRVRIPFDSEHQKLIKWLGENNYHCSYNSDLHLIVTHTHALKEAHQSLGLKGVFDTMATGSDQQDWNCFSGNTEILTKEGVKTFKECVGTEQELYVYTPEGMKWIKCPILSFGTQKTYKVRFADGYRIRATKDHRWLIFRRDKKEPISLARHHSKTTQFLGKRDELPLARVELPEKNSDYYQGYAHGFVFGDGWVENCRGKKTCTVALFKYDDDLSNLLCKYGNPGQSNFIDFGYVEMVRQLPPEWKEIPINCSKSYALGFVLGFASADGFLYSHLQISQSNFYTLEETRKLAIYAGLRVRPVKYAGISPTGYANAKPSYTLNINTYNLTEDHFIRRDHKKLFHQRKKCQTTSAIYVDRNNPIEEEVFCAVVEDYQNFTLANGIITRNCYMFALKNGAWCVKRFNRGVAETTNFFQDSQGYTTTYLNKDPDLRIASNTYGGIEDTRYGFEFINAEAAQQAATMLGADLQIPQYAKNKKTVLRRHQDGRLIAEVEYDADKDSLSGGMPGWRIEKKKNWFKIFATQIEGPSELEMENFDGLVRHLISPTQGDAGWVINPDTKIWNTEPINHISKALKSLDYPPNKIEKILGSCVFKNWKLINIPFQAEYPGNRQWNREAAQLRYQPLKTTDNLNYPTWIKLLYHLGSSLDDALADHEWAKENNILKGGDYLKLWIASVLQSPEKKLPYLFLYGEKQKTGKSSFHQALRLLMTKGVVNANIAIQSTNHFNGELENAVVCAIEEIDFSKDKKAFNKLKDWVTNPFITIRKLYVDAYQMDNYSHWLHSSNERQAAPVFINDDRITMIYVDSIAKEDFVETGEFFRNLDKESQHFITHILSLDIPPCNDRFAIPVINTQEKVDLQEYNLSSLERYIKENRYFVEGEVEIFASFYNDFQEWLDPNETHLWSKVRVTRELPLPYCKGKLGANVMHIGNMAKKLPENGQRKPKWIAKDDKLIQSASGVVNV